MGYQSIISKNPSQLKHNAILVGVVWTLIIAGLLGWNLRGHKKDLLDSVSGYAHSAYNQIVLYRRWVVQHGGVYVPPTGDHAGSAWGKQ